MQGNDLQHTMGILFLPTLEETAEHTLVDETPPIFEVSIVGVSKVVTEFFDDISASQADEVSEDKSTIVEELIGTNASGFMEELSDDNHMQMTSEHAFHIGVSMEDGVHQSIGLALEEVLGDREILDDGYTQ